MSTSYAQMLIVALLGLGGLSPTGALATGEGTMRADGETSLLRVGPMRSITSLAAASKLARDGDSIEVDAGDYVGDVAVWSQSGLALRAVNGRARLIANGQAAEGKGIWVVRAERIRVQGFDFVGARTPHRNGAGIRLESGSLEVDDCAFLNNQNGILTSNNRNASLAVENSEFAFNGAGDGLSHNLYAGEIASLTVTGSYFHHANVGHLLKSRAAVNRIRYNRLTDEAGGRASYELNLPNGGLAYVIGNIFQQSASTENPHLISYGEEGYKWPRNEFYLINNTLVDTQPRRGIALRVSRGTPRVTVANNLLVNFGQFDTAAVGDYRNNRLAGTDDFAATSAADFQLKSRSKLRGTAIDIGKDGAENLMPQGEYSHPRRWRPLQGQARDPGALQTPN